MRPADLIEPGWERAVQESRELAQNEEDILSYALFPQVAIKFLSTVKREGTAV